VAFTVIIPARFSSTRLPGKILKDIHGKTLLHRVYDCVKKSTAKSIIVATDDQRIVDEANNIGVDVCMTSQSHKSGTQRISEVITQRKISKDSIIVNVQGDEPFLPAACIEQVAELLAQDTQAEMATLCTPLLSKSEIFDSNVVKVVMNNNDQALYFSRAPIPWHRDEWAHNEHEHNTAALSIPKNVFRHIGLYAYRARFIQTYVDYPASQLENIEKLEQLRALWYGHTIKIAQAIEIPGPGIDNEADLMAAKKFVKEQESNDA